MANNFNMVDTTKRKTVRGMRRNVITSNRYTFDFNNNNNYVSWDKTTVKDVLENYFQNMVCKFDKNINVGD